MKDSSIQVNFQLTVEELKRLDEMAGHRQRSAFLRQLINREYSEFRKKYDG